MTSAAAGGKASPKKKLLDNTTCTPHLELSLPSLMFVNKSINCQNLLAHRNRRDIPPGSSVCAVYFYV